jgi:hypothetical protein
VSANRPSPSVRALRTGPTPCGVTVIEASGTTAPDGSRTTPVSDGAVCACAATAAAKRNTRMIRVDGRLDMVSDRPGRQSLANTKFQ